MILGGWLDVNKMLTNRVWCFLSIDMTRPKSNGQHE